MSHQGIRALRAIFASQGWDVAIAATLNEGLAALSWNPEWVILDLMLPDGRGEIMLRTIKTQGLPMRVAVTTGTSDQTRLEDVRRLGAEAVMQKPIDVRKLIQQMQ